MRFSKLRYLFGRKAGVLDTNPTPATCTGMHIHERIMWAYNLRGLAGYTADECAHEIGVGILTIRPRITELFQAGSLRRTGEKRTNYSGLKAHVFVSTRIPTARG